MPDLRLPLSARTAAPVTLEGVGMHPGRALRATLDEVAEQDRLEAERNAAANAVVDQALMAAVSCRICHANALGNRDGLCDPCSAVVVRLRSDAAMADVVGGRTRRELCEDWLAAQQAEV
jgi:hypothetical protein